MRDIQTRFPLHFALAWLGTTLILLLRSWQDLVYPVAAYEDHTYLLAIFGNSHYLPDIFHIYNGYAAVTAQLIAWLLGFLPLPWIPYAFACTALLISSLAFSLFALPQYNFLCRNPNHRLFLCILLATLPLGRQLLTSNLTYSQFVFIFILIMLVASARYRRTNILIDWLIIPLCICAYPGSITLLPLYLLQILLGDRQQKIRHAAYIAITFVYIALLVDTSVTDIMSPDYFVMHALIAGSAITGKILIEPWIGAELSAALFSTGDFFAESGHYMRNTAVAGIVIAALASIGFLLHLYRRTEPQMTAYLILLTGFAIMAMSIFTRNTGMGWSIHLQGSGMQSYAFTPRLCLLVFLCCLFSAWIDKNRSLQNYATIAGGLLLAIAAHMNITNASLYASAKDESLALMAFLQAVEQEIDNGNDACRQRQDCIRSFQPDDRWPVVLDLGK
jgi:hypothetical protein